MKFLNECIRFAYGELSARIILHNKKEIKKLSFILKSYSNKKKILFSKIENKYLYDLLKNKDLFKNKDLISNNILNKVKQVKYNFKEIYIYCAAIHGVATLNILQKNNLKIKLLIDDNVNIEKQTMVNVGIIKGASFFRTKKGKISKMLILVCQQTIETFRKIAKKLKLNGFKSNQIVNVRF